MSLITGDGTVFVGERKILLEERIVTAKVETIESELGPIKVTPEGVAHVMSAKIKAEPTNKQVPLRLYMYPDGTMRYE